MRRLWPDSGAYDFDDETVFVWDRGDGRLGGFVSVSTRPWAEGCVSEPVAYIEGWFVDEDLRRQGVGSKLFAAAEDWARAGGFTEIGSDAELDNDISIAAHLRLGYRATTRLQHFQKDLVRDHP
jgi:aminoglycoside 6'-N-acetyltransferase I